MKRLDEEISLRSSDSTVTSSFETTSNPPLPDVRYSEFGDAACGEPLAAQRLLIDFTPLAEVDNDFVQRKCCAFWDFISNRPDLQSLMVEPDAEGFMNKYETGDSDTTESKTDVSSTTKERTAVSVLELVEEKGLIDRAFEAKILQSHCSLGSREYKENELATQLKDKSATTKKLRLNSSKRHVEDPSTQVLKMCQTMREWDSDHPKSMDPPGHPPALSHAVMQRTIPT